MSVIDLNVNDTTPGAGGPFCPPAEFRGTDRDYGRWLWEQYQAHGCVAMYLHQLWWFVRRWHARPAYTGPYAERLEAAIAAYEKLQQTPAA